MASYRGHLMFASLLGAGYGAAGALWLNYDWGRSCLAAGLTTIGGLLPDLDSDSGVPVRELFGLTAACAPLVAHDSLRQSGFTPEQTLVLMGAMYLLIRFGLSQIFKSWTVHRGMFHSVPALLISGLVVYLAYRGRPQEVRLYLAGAIMLGFLSHLVLDELCSVDFMGLRLRLNRYAGSALKLASSSALATLLTYAVLGGLGYLAWLDWQGGVTGY
jgi:hypothetical protein